MNATQSLHGLGQSLWLDNITRTILADGTLARYIAGYSVTGLTSNPTIFDEAIAGTAAYDADLEALAGQGVTGEDAFIRIALDDLRRAADMFAPTHAATNGVDGWVSMEVSPLLAADTAGTVAAAKAIHAQAQRANLFVKIPGTPEGVPAIEEAIFAGVPVNVTLLFSAEQYRAAAEAYLRGIERRIAAGMDPDVASVASVFISRWDKAVAASVPAELKNQLGIAIGQRTHRAYRDLLASARMQKIIAAGGRAQRLLWASTGTKDPAASDVLYVEALAAPDTIDTIPDKTLRAFADHGRADAGVAADAAAGEAMLARFAQAGVDVVALAARLQTEGAAAFVKSWNELLSRIADKTRHLSHAGAA
ncbi:MAG: transaldolase [Proteobacteria bacterium]|nr:transaldolase [Pseudomonadota bacterium]